MYYAHAALYYLIDGVLVWIILLLAQRWIFNIQNKREIYRRKLLLKKILPVIESTLNDILKDLKNTEKETTNEKNKDLDPEEYDDDEDLDNIVDDFLK